MRIGVHPQPGFNGWYKGVIDEVTLYRRALTNTEVTALYTAGCAAKCKHDLDYDGLPDWWEIKYFGNLDQTATGDPDGDGRTNLQEYQNGTDPTDYYNGVLPILCLANNSSDVYSRSNFIVVPLTVQVSSTNGSILTNAPLTFAVSNGTAQLSTATNGVLSTNFSSRTDIAGKVAGWIFIPTNSTTTNQITVTATSGTNTTQIQMAASVVSPTAKTYSLRIAAQVPPDPYTPAVALYWQNYCRSCSGGGGPRDATNTYGGNMFLTIARVEPLANTTMNVSVIASNTQPGYDYELLSKTDLSEFWKPEQITNAATTNVFYAPLAVTNNSKMLFAAKRGSPIVSILPGLIAIEPNTNSSYTGQVGTIQISLSATQALSLNVFYRISGTASNGMDYTNISDHVTIQAGQLSTNVFIDPIEDDLVECGESVTLTLVLTNGYLIAPDCASAAISVADEPGVHFCGLTNDSVLSGIVQLPVEAESDEGTLTSVGLFVDGAVVENSKSLSQPFDHPLSLSLDTSRLYNGGHTIQASATWIVHRTNTFESPFVQKISDGLFITTTNPVFYPDWTGEAEGTNMIINAVSGYADVDWQIKIYGSQFDYITVISNHSNDGSIQATWNLQDTNGTPRSDAIFYTTTTISGSALTSAITVSNPPTVKRTDNYPYVGQWVTAYLDWLPHDFANYSAWRQALNGIALMGEEAGGVLPGSPQRSAGEIYLLHTGPTYTNYYDMSVLWQTMVTNLEYGTGNRVVRNFYYEGHASPDYIGDEWGGFGESFLEQMLNNGQSSTNDTRYRFVWLDGCETAVGNWPTAFHLGQEQAKPLSSYTRRPGVFMGYMIKPTIGVGLISGGAVRQEAIHFLTEFYTQWTYLRRGVYESVDNARRNSGFNDAIQLRIYGYWNLHWKEYNTKAEWPPP